MTNIMIPSCSVCGMKNTYPDGDHFICPDCSHEWSAIASKEESKETRIHKDAYGNVLNDGDTVTLIKDLKVKNSSLVIKGGTKITNIRLVDGQSILLKSEFMKKA